MAEKKIIAVVGATGAQGGGLVRAIRIVSLSTGIAFVLESSVNCMCQRNSPYVLPDNDPGKKWVVNP